MSGAPGFPSAARAYFESEPFIAAVNRCATQEQGRETET
jgi:hypothetical protein